ncbi:MAG: glycosyltransferase [Bacilli bacterium]|nr:glycosyltransferase [Bacilli bacterium]
MKKIMFLQINSHSFGGIWEVNHTLGEEFIKRGYLVSMLAIRQNHPGIKEKVSSKFKINTINKIVDWKILRKKEVINSIKKGPSCFIRTFIKYFGDKKKLKEDYLKMKKFIIKENPDFIIASHYQTLPGIPKKFLSKTIHVQHSSFKFADTDKVNIRVLKKYNDKVFCLMWLCNSIMNNAIKRGFLKNRYIYNPLKFRVEKKANVCKNKKIVVITRISSEKRIDLMVEIVNNIFSDEKFKDWSFEIYGNGEFNEASKKIISNSTQIFYNGVTDNPKEVLMNSSINLNTSIFEGFSLSIIEASACGLPTIAFDFGDAAYEQIINDSTGYIVENDDVLEFQNKLKYLMSDMDKLEELSLNNFEFAHKFYIKEIADEWEKLFKEIEVSR